MTGKAKFMMPGMSLMGSGALSDAGEEISKLRYKKALVVTDKPLVDIGLAAKVTEVLNQNGIRTALYSGTQPNPTVTNVREGLKLYKDSDCDCVVSLGGGSPHDCAKGIALLAGNGGEIGDYEGVDISAEPAAPLIAINTTAGTASEMTMFCIITDEERHIKMAIVDKHTTPLIAVNDPDLMMAMPKSLTAATGMDALTHAIEAYVSINATPITDACALKAINIIRDFLVRAVDDGSDKEAREQMAYAEFLAGMAFNNAGLGYVHAMAHQLGGFYNLPHGVCNAILLPHVERYNSVKASARLKDVAQALGRNTDGVTAEEGAALALEAIEVMAERVGIPSGLSALGVKREDFPVLAANALKDACGVTNPVQGSHDEIMEIFEYAM
ncbi:L-threonine dehydrogenase [Paenibacillus rhizophilus]|uniref:L-threonine dehydrogenase n=1 Tax=Paenibacillus rhizophilus TaxID=1850366 RepID=A0A3N9PBC7_9BACL|nr:L-threonine dehydrogenase [Paenibacillus rhizophilus]RQW13573.1 L-threonine dehydrogenase [Paenibacillus rhizophilus]